MAVGTGMETFHTTDGRTGTGRVVPVADATFVFNSESIRDTRTVCCCAGGDEYTIAFHYEKVVYVSI